MKVKGEGVMNFRTPATQRIAAVALCLLCLSRPLAAEQQGDRQTLFLSLEEAIGVALENNLDIAVEQFQPEIAKEAIVSTEAVFDSNFESRASQSFNESEYDTTPVSVSSLDLSLGKAFRFGGSYQLEWSSSLSAFDGTTLSPTGDKLELDNQYKNSFALSYRQPLLKNAGSEVNTTAIAIARKKRDLSISRLRSTVIAVVTDVKNSYWELVNAIAELKAAELSLRLAEDLVKINEARVNVGALAPIEILQAKAQAASRKASVTTAELAVQNSEDRLRQLLDFAEDDPVWNSSIVPTDAPSETAPALSLADSISFALEHFEELKQFRTTIDIQERALMYAENQMKADMNLIASMGTTGANTHLGDSLTGVIDLNNFSVTLGANFSYALGNRAAKSAYHQAKLQRDQSRLAYRNQEQALIVNVRAVHRNVLTAYELIASTRLARQLAEKQLDAEQKKFNEGLSTNFQILEYQNHLKQARSNEALALTSYNQALANLDSVIGYTLQRHNIVIQE
ncbi:hypothetical protein CSB45_11540 [candidate division KSB3 bacterium]|uniref:Transporter n=1 Tax=candidate division KSB3 bacterium TaxID=2044937 RepID=A0A2G6E3D6_9BACT|nr:MAG: hypothetical protein CSB45_11540 [candidate division KSB3 bacterium]PIE28945.1 MAG: hypothetical protein CSA57_11590 [candidate division KSB3 bacterium]